MEVRAKTAFGVRSRSYRLLPFAQRNVLRLNEPVKTQLNRFSDDQRRQLRGRSPRRFSRNPFWLGRRKSTPRQSLGCSLLFGLLVINIPWPLICVAIVGSTRGDLRL